MLLPLPPLPLLSGGRVMFLADCMPGGGVAAGTRIWTVIPGRAFGGHCTCMVRPLTDTANAWPGRA